MNLPKHAPAGKPFWWYPLWAAPVPEALIAAMLWLIHQNYTDASPAVLTALLPDSEEGYFNLLIWMQCAFIALVISLIVPVFPVNIYIPEAILLTYTVVAFLVGVYYQVWGVGVEIGLGLISYSGRATLIAGVSLLVRRLLLQWRLGRTS